MNIQPKNKAELENCLGVKVARSLIARLKADRKGSQPLRRMPYSVSFKESKGTNYLGDYDTLTLYVVELATGDIKAERYCGSFDSALNHPEQGQSFDAIPAGYAMIFVTITGGSGNLSWGLEVVSKDLVKQVVCQG